MFNPGQEIYFHSWIGPHIGTVEKINKNTINVLEADSTKPDGYQLWRITEYFLAETPEEAEDKWFNYHGRLKQFQDVIYDQRHNRCRFEKGMNVIVNSLNGPPYKALILKLNKASLTVVTEDNKLMKVDKAICEPTFEFSNFLI